MVVNKRNEWCGTSPCEGTIEPRSEMTEELQLVHIRRPYQGQQAVRVEGNATVGETPKGP